VGRKETGEVKRECGPMLRVRSKEEKEEVVGRAI